MMSQRSTLLLRIAAAITFIYPPVDAYFTPNAWISYFPSFVLNLATAHSISNVVLLSVWGIVEVIIGLWILSGRHIFWPSLVATLLLVAIVLFNIPLMEILFRDVALALVTLTLTIWSYKKGQV
jgi:uncharacterized membrane protein YphA (DoxX/SURF4 family)